MERLTDALLVVWFEQLLQQIRGFGRQMLTGVVDVEFEYLRSGRKGREWVIDGVSRISESVVQREPARIDPTKMVVHSPRPPVWRSVPHRGRG